MSSRLLVIVAAYLAICAGIYFGYPSTPASEVATAGAISQDAGFGGSGDNAATAQNIAAAGATVDPTLDAMETVQTETVAPAVNVTRNVSPADRISLLEVWTAIEECRVARCEQFIMSDFGVEFIPDEIRDLDRLSTVVTGKKVADISALRDMRSLRIVNLSDSQVENIGSLGQNPGIRFIGLANTEVASLQGLGALTALEHIDLANTEITDLSPIAGNSAINYLNASNTGVFSAAPLADLFELKDLYLSGSNILDMAVVADLTALEVLDVSNTQLAALPNMSGNTALRELNISNTLIADLTPLRQLANLQVLDLSGTQVRDISRLAGLQSLREINLAGTNVRDFDALLGLRNLQTVTLPDVEEANETLVALRGRGVALQTAEGDNFAIAAAAGGEGGELIRFLTGTQYAPYVGDDLPEGGFSTELINMAMAVAPGAPHDLTVNVNWSEHFDPLLSSGQYDLGYPWYRPDCEVSERLDDEARWRCDNLQFSRPLHEVLISAYALRDVAADIRTPEDAFGLRICRPDGYFTFDLLALGLTPETMIRVAPESPRECFEGLRDGTVDIVVLNAGTSEFELEALDLLSDVSEVFALSSVQTLHVVGMKGSQKAAEAIRRLDIGLLNLRRDGTFQRLSRKHE